MILGITATRYDITVRQMEALEEWIRRADVDEVHHGDCMGGDAWAHSIALGVSKHVVVHPPTNHRWRAFCDVTDIVTLRPPLPYLDRNRMIVESCDVLLALPYTQQEVTRSGTWMTIRHARSRGKLVEVVLPRVASIP